MRPLLFVFALTAIISCNKNEPPVCSIITPQENSLYMNGDTLEVQLEAEDPDGMISEVRLSLDKKGISSNSEWPFSFLMNITDISEGDHILKIEAIDNEGSKGSDEVTIRIGHTGSVKTDTVRQIKSDSAWVGGIINDPGSEEIFETGVFYGTVTDPELTGTKLVIDNEENAFHGWLTGLEPNTIYNIKAYVKNELGVVYGREQHFKTYGLAVVNTLAADSVIYNAAIISGITVSDGGKEIIEAGFYLGRNKNPIENGTKYEVQVTGQRFNLKVTELDSMATYYFAAYADNGFGETRGEVLSFTTPDKNTVFDIDGNEYYWVKIGDQYWMAENLKVTKLNDGTSLNFMPNNANWEATNSAAYCWYNNDSEMKDIYGALYNGYAAQNNKICPSGWRVPTESDWTELQVFLGIPQGESQVLGWIGTDQGGMLKATGTTLWAPPNEGATNEFGFNALPGGRRLSDGSYGVIKEGAYFWSSTHHTATELYRRVVTTNRAEISRAAYQEKGGFSIRCIKE